MKQLYLVLSLLITTDCSIEQSKPRPTPVVTDNNFCKNAQNNLLKLNCEEGKPTKKGKTFEQFCLETQENGVFLNPRCLSNITNCSEIDNCTNSK